MPEFWARRQKLNFQWKRGCIVKNNEDIIEKRRTEMAGLKQTIFKGMIENFRCEDAEKYLCVDNDSAGLNFIASVKSEYPNVKMLTPIGEHKD